ncbi:hypothetical protein [Xanthobacter agilis]|uniref:Uncharacterized protein n=1 Tax=Xanthobacter agilis TaxID=47492 RepID=A0ABU0LJY5_XANAG|nr:hypothetical protein [Xanthobacter agilis]MDQ0507443.1 hypothetical protein [Xanthobacter agilis]
MTISKFGDITVRDLGSDGATLEFPKNAEWADDLKVSFPKVRWAPTTRVWGIPGKLGYKRACQWAERIASGNGVVDRQKLIDSAAFDGLVSKYVRLGTAQSIVRTAYDEEIVAICRKLGGAFDRDEKIWVIPGANLAALIQATPGIDRLAAAASARDSARKAARKAEAQAIEAAARQEQDEHLARVRAHRYVVLASKAPVVGATVRLYGNPVTVESLGKLFRADDELSSRGGPIGAEGEWVRYAYYRDATAAEMAVLEATETKRAEAARIARAQAEAIHTVAASADAPELGHAPEGEVIWRDDRHAVTGYRRWVVLTADGWLWHITYDGSDGAMWGDYNCGYNSQGTRVPARDDLVAAIRGQA